MNSQQRILAIAKRLLLGEKLKKQELMEEYGKSSSAIQRDIAYINDILFNDVTDSPSLLSTGKDKGIYHLEQPFLSNALNQLSESEVFAIAAILTASRAFENKEYESLFDKIISLGAQPDIIKKDLGNDYIEYQGVPDSEVLEKINFILHLIHTGQGIEFTYTKNRQTLFYQRTPFQIFFSDLYFYMATDNHHSEDDTDFSKLNKFRINQMTDLRAIPRNKRLGYNERFKAGELRKSTWLPFYGKELTLVIDFYYDPCYVLDRFPNSRIIEQTDEYTRFALKVNDGWGIKMWLLTQSTLVKVISPKHMVDFVVDAHKRALSLYDEK